ncbi:MAG: hypothetical protein RLZZ381_2945 [Cyanobacteriota bacterium]
MNPISIENTGDTTQPPQVKRLNGYEVDLIFTIGTELVQGGQLAFFTTEATS